MRQYQNLINSLYSFWLIISHSGIWQGVKKVIIEINSKQKLSIRYNSSLHTHNHLNQQPQREL